MRGTYYDKNIRLSRILGTPPCASAEIKGSAEYPNISGTVKLYRTAAGVIVYAEVAGLPEDGGIFAFHIHSGGECAGNAEDPFADAGAHYDTKGRPHPYHAGDLPPLFSNGGRALSVFLTDRFSADEAVGKTVIIHSRPDDLMTQPSGNSGEKIACGVIRKAGICRRKPNRA